MAKRQRPADEAEFQRILHQVMGEAMAASPETRGPALLRRALAFLHPTVSVSKLSPEDRHTWWVFLTHLLPGEPRESWGTTTTVELPGGAHLKRLQRTLRDGVKHVLTGEKWVIPGPKTAFIRRLQGPPDWPSLAPRNQAPDASAPTVPPVAYQWGWRVDDPIAVAQLGVARLIRRYGERLRACAQCSAPFLAVKRQIYCGPGCTKLGQRPRRTEG